MTTRIEEQINKGFIHFSTILEIVGKPKEHVDATFADFISQMKKSVKYEVVKSTVHEAIAVEGSENLFSSFAEIEVIAQNMGALFDFCFENMPASVEILAPAELRLKPNQASAAVNDLIGRIHHLDLQSKQLTQQIGIYQSNLHIMIENAIVIYLSNKPNSLENISKVVGVSSTQITSFLESLIKKGRIVKTNGVYGIAGKNIELVKTNSSQSNVKSLPGKESVISLGKSNSTTSKSDSKSNSKEKNKKKGKK